MTNPLDRYKYLIRSEKGMKLFLNFTFMWAGFPILSVCPTLNRHTPTGGWITASGRQAACLTELQVVG